MEDYEFWRTMLDNPKALGKSIFTNETEPQTGFYRTKSGKPVAIWRGGGGDLMIMEGKRMVSPEDFGALWMNVLNRPVEEEHYRAVMDGGVWHDLDEIVLDTIGDNIGRAADPETISELIDMLERAATAYFDKLFENDDEAAKAQSIRARLNELVGKADKLREEQKAPHLEAGRAVDATWQPMIKKADATGKRIRLSLARYENWKREEEAKRRIAEAQALHDRQPPPEEPTAPAPKATIKGGYGRAASVRVLRKVTAIDVEKVFQVYKAYQSVIDLLTKLAQEDINRGLPVPGATVEEVTDVR